MFTGQVWAPVAFTQPLSENFPSDGYKLIELVEKHWRTPEGGLVKLDDWQKSLLIHVLERYPLDHPNPNLAGRLRYRQVVISMGRQNGKSIIGGILSLYGLLKPGPSVVGVATSVEQANVVYQRTAYAVKNDPTLNKVLKATGTRGVTRRDGSGQYKLYPSLPEGLQSVPVTLCVADELHLSQAAMWDSIVKGQTAQRDGLLVGVTTAGDENSALLKRLYKQGYDAIQDPESRFGFFLWEAPAGSTLDTPGAVEAANPAVACGRIPLERILSDVRFQPESEQQRYTLNQFIASVNPWLPTTVWKACANGGVKELLGKVKSKDLFFSFERTPDLDFVSCMVSVKYEGKLYTELALVVEKPSHEQLVRVCKNIQTKHRGASFVVPADSMSWLGKALRDKNYTVYILTTNEVTQACAVAYAKFMQRLVSYPKDIDPIVPMQIPLARRKNTTDGNWKILRSESELGSDTVMGMINGLFMAETKEGHVTQLF